MVRYARSDVMGAYVSVAHGGCGQQHTRPVRNGAPVKIWALDCARCEPYLSGSTRPKIIKNYPGDPKNGIPPRQEWVADAHPMWSSTQDTIPLTPDEQAVNATRRERGTQQLQMIQALSALRASGLDIPPEAMWLLESELPPGVLRGTMVCPAGHDNPAGVKFCGECGAGMTSSRAVEAALPVDPVPPVDLIPLASLHIATLKKKCRDQGLPDSGTKDQLIRRLGGL